MKKDAIRVEVVSSIDGFDALRNEWNSLLEESPSESPFLRWEWARDWWGSYREKRTGLSILLVYNGDKLTGIAPFYRTNVSAEFMAGRRLMFLGTLEDALVSEYMDFICRTEDYGFVIRNVLEEVSSHDLADEILLSTIPSSSPSSEVLRAVSNEKNITCHLAEAGSCPYIPLPSTFDEFLNESSPQLRQSIRSAQRKLQKYPRYEFRRTGTPRELEGDFEELVRLHQMRWRSRGKPGAFSDARFTGFHREATRRALEDGILDLSFLSVEGRNIAAVYNISYKGRIYYYQSGLDASFDPSLSPGLLLHAHSIERAIRAGAAEYDFLLSGETDEYKERWTGFKRPLNNVYLTTKGVNRLILSAKQYLRRYATRNTE